jgi:hypothetical protein
VDKTTLVERDVKIGNDIIAFLAGAGVDVEDALWVYSPPIDEWRLLLATNLVDKKGSIAAYQMVLKILKDGGILEDVPYRRMSLLSPCDPVFSRLRSELRIDRNRAFHDIGRSDLRGAYVYEGAIHIVRDQRPNMAHVSRVMFAPYRGEGGAVPTVEFRTEQALQDFLTNELGIAEATCHKVLQELGMHAHASIGGVRIEQKDLRRWHLLPDAARHRHR